MNPLDYLPDIAHGHLPSLIVLVVALVCVAALPFAIKQARKSAAKRRKVSLAVALGFIAAAGCTMYSGRASWVFAEKNLHITDTTERISLFAVGEIVLLALIFMARQNLNGKDATPGIYGLLAKVVVGVQILPAYMVSDDVISGTVVAFFGPVMAMIMWHLMLDIELKHKKPDVESMSMWAQIGRELRTRVFAYMGLARRERTALEIIQDRYLNKAVDYERSIELLGDFTWKWLERKVRVRLERKLDAAIAKGIAGDPQRRTDYLNKLNERRGTQHLRTLKMYDSWTATAARMDQEQFPEAHALSQQTAQVVREGVMRAATPPDLANFSNAILNQLGQDAAPVPSVQPEPEPEPVAPKDSAMPALYERMQQLGIPLPDPDAKPFSDIDPALKPKPEPVKEPEDDGPDEDPDPEPPAREPVREPQPEPAREHPVPPAEPKPAPKPEPVRQPEPVGAGRAEETGAEPPKTTPDDLKTQARNAYKDSVRAAAENGGDIIKAVPLAEKFGMKERWGFERIKEAKKELEAEAATPHLRAVPNN